MLFMNHCGNPKTQRIYVKKSHTGTLHFLIFISNSIKAKLSGFYHCWHNFNFQVLKIGCELVFYFPWTLRGRMLLFLPVFSWLTDQHHSGPYKEKLKHKSINTSPEHKANVQPQIKLSIHYSWFHIPFVG